MPLPNNPKAAWPPPAMKPVFDRIAEWSAWYSSDTDSLARIYGDNTGGRGTVFNRPAQFAGGLVGIVARMFWGQPTPAGQQRTKLHVPLAADMARKSASLLYSEPPTLTFDDANTAATDRVAQLVDDGLMTIFTEGADVAAALSGVYYRIVWDKAVRPLPWIVPVHPDAAVPEWRWGELAAVTFWEVLERGEDDKDPVVRHLERHEPGMIQHAVYVGTDSEIGERVDLAAYAATQGFAEAAELGSAGVTVADNIAMIATTPGRITAEYVPNIRPARGWRNNTAAAAMGGSDYAGVEGLLDALDEAWTSWMRDLRLAKARLMVPEQYLSSLGPGQGAAWSAEQEIFTALKIMPSGDGRNQIEANQFAIRVEEHARTVAELQRTIVSQAGYAAQTFGLSGDVAITATEVNARERDSFILRDLKIRYQKPPITRLIETLLILDRELFGATAEPERPRMDFPDGVSDSVETIARTLQLLEAARAISTEYKVRMLHPEWPDEDIDDEVDRIREEQNIGGTVETPGEFGAPVPAGPPNDGSVEEDPAPVEEDAPAPGEE